MYREPVSRLRPDLLFVVRCWRLGRIVRIEHNEGRQTLTVANVSTDAGGFPFDHASARWRGLHYLLLRGASKIIQLAVRGLVRRRCVVLDRDGTRNDKWDGIASFGRRRALTFELHITLQKMDTTFPTWEIRPLFN